jgi:hypothetical protein
MARQRAFWRGRPPRAAPERQELALASYNAGGDNIVKAQTACLGARLWSGIAPCVSRITGDRNARETQGYVDMIMRRRGADGADAEGQPMIGAILELLGLGRLQAVVGAILLAAIGVLLGRMDHLAGAHDGAIGAAPPPVTNLTLERAAPQRS